jgi:hypothetical protein
VLFYHVYKNQVNYFQSVVFSTQDNNYLLTFLYYTFLHDFLWYYIHKGDFEMSLTRQLAKDTSPLSIYFKDNFTKLPELLRPDNLELAKCPSLLPSDQKGYLWAEVGHMVEYLICLSIGVPLNDLMPMKHLVSANGFTAKNLAKEITTAFKYPLDADNTHFAEQCKYLWVLAEMEAGIRNEGKINMKFVYPVVPPVMLNDLRAIFKTSIKNNELLKGKHVYNPTFDLSSAVGGADADLIKVNPNKENMLIDIKTTKNPQVTLSWIYQLLGYVFLDKTNYYKMHDVGIYMPRQNVMLNWTVEDLILQGSTFESVKVAKKEFIKAVDLVHNSYVASLKI